MENDTLDRAIAAIYRAASGQERFDVALERICEGLGEGRALGSQMIGVDPATGGLTFSHANSNVPGEGELEYIRTYHAVDPRVPMLLPRAPGDWMWCEDVFSDEQALSNPYYRDLLVPYGGRYTATAKLSQGEREVVLIGFMLRMEAGGFDPAQRAYLQRIGHHLQEALAIHRHVRALAVGHSVGHALIERLGKPAWIVDDRLAISGANSLAQASVRKGGALRDHEGRLATAAPDLLNPFAACIRDLVRRSDRGEASPRGFLRVPSAGAARKSVISVALFEPHATMHAFGDLRQLLVMLHDLDGDPEPDTYVWQVAFDLTPAEARVCRLVYGGASVREAAERLGVSFHTANSQLDSAYAKTGTHGKVELVQLLRSLA